MTLLIRGLLKESYNSNAWGTNIYLTRGRQDFILTRLSKTDVEDGKGERIRMGVLKDVKKSRKTGGKDPGNHASSSRGRKAGRGTKRKQLEMTEADDDDDEDDANVEDLAIEDDDADFVVMDNEDRPIATSRPSRNRKRPNRPVLASDYEEDEEAMASSEDEERVISPSGDEADMPRTSKAHTYGRKSSKQRPLGFDSNDPSEEFDDDNWSFDMKGGSVAGPSRVASNPDDIIEIPSDSE